MSQISAEKRFATMRHARLYYNVGEADMDCSAPENVFAPGLARSAERTPPAHTAIT
jgi:hypothetical protein